MWRRLMVWDQVVWSLSGELVQTWSAFLWSYNPRLVSWCFYDSKPHGICWNRTCLEVILGEVTGIFNSPGRVFISSNQEWNSSSQLVFGNSKFNSTSETCSYAARMSVAFFWRLMVKHRRLAAKDPHYYREGNKKFKGFQLKMKTICFCQRFSIPWPVTIFRITGTNSIHCGHNCRVQIIENQIRVYPLNPPCSTQVFQFLLQEKQIQWRPQKNVDASDYN